MTEYVGNANIAPHLSAEVSLVDTEIAVSPTGLIKKGVKLQASQGVLPAGTVLARVSSTKEYVVYNNAGSGGAEVAIGVLYQAVDTSTGDAVFGNIILAGVLKNSLLSGVDSSALTDLNARRDTSLDVFIF